MADKNTTGAGAREARPYDSAVGAWFIHTRHAATTGSKRGWRDSNIPGVVAEKAASFSGRADVQTYVDPHDRQSGFVAGHTLRFIPRMPDPLSDADLRRARFHCYLAAVVFAACAVALLFLPIEMKTALRGVAAGFNLILALAIFLYGRHLANDA